MGQIIDADDQMIWDTGTNPEIHWLGDEFGSRDSEEMAHVAKRRRLDPPVGPIQTSAEAECNSHRSSETLDVVNTSHAWLSGTRQKDVEILDWVDTNHIVSPALSSFPTLFAEENETSVDRVVCYGAVCEVQAKFLKKPHPPSAAEGFIFLGPILLEGSYFFMSYGETEKIAVLDNLSSERLQSLKAFRDALRIVPVVQYCDFKKATKNSKIQLSMNILGPESLAKKIGTALDETNTGLQHPYALEDGVDYINPHFYHPDGPVVMTHFVGMDEAKLRAKQLSDEVDTIFGSLDSPNVSNSSALETVSQSEKLLVTLRDTQLAALRFMVNRENEDNCRRLHEELQNLVAPDHPARFPTLATGGIIADSMGLGKTLTALSLIMHTLDLLPKQEHHRAHIEDCQDFAASYTTLVVVPSSQVLDVWQREIEIRLVPGSLRTAKFHGSDRARTTAQLTANDVVLTTYATLVEDNKRTKLLQKIAWFRILLDEAHWIRNSKSKQFRACESLSSQRRWCLTGTPIQNRLEDLGSLISFLHIHPFSDLSVFRKRILEPLTSDAQHRTRGLQLLLQTVCLRRDSKELKVPEPEDIICEVSLSEQERQGYTRILEESRREIELIVSQGESTLKKYNVLFMAMLKLRRCCNTGTFHLRQDNDNTCGTCNESDEDNLLILNGLTDCIDCGRVLRTKKGSLINASAVVQANTSSEPMAGEYSSKLCRLMQNARTMKAGDKSVVFSYWTSTLDLAEALLGRIGISCTRIDGTVSYSERLRRLDLFRSEPDMSILLMTISTGAVGLNITAANFVHIMEPQWNPSVEEQAIARAVRIGQTRKVTIFRYIVQQSVEQNIVHLQKKKQHLAKFTLGGLDDSSAGKLEDLKFVLHVD